MTQEDKTKAYDYALKKMKSKLKDFKEIIISKDDIEEIFPALKENEDERIRKELIDYIGRLTASPNYIEKYNSWISWLEKQDKNQKLTETRVTDYKKKYKKALETIKGSVDTLNEIYKAGTDVVNIQSIKNCFYKAFPELEESDKEVDLNTAITDYIIRHTSEVSGYFDIRRIARHFFDLGLKVQKED